MSCVISYLYGIYNDKIMTLRNKLYYLKDKQKNNENKEIINNKKIQKLLNQYKEIFNSLNNIIKFEDYYEEKINYPIELYNGGGIIKFNNKIEIHEKLLNEKEDLNDLLQMIKELNNNIQ